MKKSDSGKNHSFASVESRGGREGDVDQLLHADGDPRFVTSTPFTMRIDDTTLFVSIHMHV